MPTNRDEIKKDLFSYMNAVKDFKNSLDNERISKRKQKQIIKVNADVRKDANEKLFYSIQNYINENPNWDNDAIIILGYILVRSKDFSDFSKEVVNDCVTYYKFYEKIKNKNQEKEEDTIIEYLVDRYNDYINDYKKIRRRPFNIILVLFIIFIVGVVGLYTYEYFKKPYYYDNSSSISVSLDKDSINTIDKFSAKLSIEEIKETSVEYEVVKNALKEITDDFMAVDIKLYNSNKDLKVNSPVSVTMPIPASYNIHNISVYHISDDMQIEKLDIEISSINNTITFKTSSFSIFAICAEPYTVTFIDYSEYDQKAFWGEKAYEPDAPIKVGYNFLGWYIGEEKYNFGKNITGNIVLTPKFEIKTFSIRLDVNGGDSLPISNINIQYEAEFTLPVPSKIGYSFTGWYYNDELFTDGTFTELDDIVLVAKWVERDYVITLNPNGGEVKDNLINVKYEAEYSLPTPTKNGYTFLGWFYNNKEFSSGKYTEASDIELLAKWDVKSYVIHYDGNGASNITNLNENVKYDSIINYPEPVRLGYEFLGWFLGDQLFNEEVFKKEEDIDLVAKWKVCEYVITLNPSGGLVDNTIINIEYEEKITLPTPTKTGYEFLGWYYKSRVYEEEVYYETSDIELVARWSANNYTISFDVNGATNINSYSSSIDYDAEIKYPSLVRTGYEFLGWYYNDVLFNDKNFKNENDVNLVAKWKAYDYVITLNTDGGTLDIDNIKVVYGEALNIPSPTKTGYTFTGWYYKNNKYESTNYYELSDIELLAKWEANSYTISFDVDGANNASNYSESIKYDAKINYPNLVKTGYEFQGWLYNEVLFNDEYYNELNNITLVADWKVCEYTITLNADGGDIGYSEIIREYGASIDLPTPIKTGYTFNGWFYKNDKFNDVVYYRTEDIILDARWTANTYTVTYNVNGGDSLGYSSKEVTYDGYITLPSPLRTGYTFTGWYYGSVLFDSVVYKETSSITIEAHWDANEYNLVMGDYIKKVTYDSAVGELYSIPNKTGYNATSSWLIDGNPIDSSLVWKYTTDKEAVVTYSPKTYELRFGSSVRYCVYDGTIGSLPEIDTIEDGGYIMVGHWEIDGFTITKDTIWNYDSNKEAVIVRVNQAKMYTITCGDKQVTVTYGSQIGNLPTMSKTGYTFDGWYVGNDLLTSTTIYNYESSVVASAKYTPITYEISFDKNISGLPITVVYTISETTITYDAKSVNSSILSSNTYFTIDGLWTDKTNGTKVVNSDGTLCKNVAGYTNSNGEWIKSSDAYLYAHWVKSQTYSSYTYIANTKTSYSIKLTEMTNTGNYLLIDNINMNNVSWTPIDKFAGVLNGDYHSIYGLEFTQGSQKSPKNGDYRYGMFRSIISGAEIKFLTLTNFHVEVWKYKDDMTENSAGILVGIMEGGSLFNVTIDNCSISMSNERHVGSGNKFYVYTGGVVGKMTGGTINYVTIKNSKIYGRSFKPSPNGGKVCGCCGGIVGKVDNTSGTAIMIQNSKFLDNYIHCSVANEEAGSGAIALGGIVGYMAASSGSVTVSNCKVEIANQTSHSSANKDNGFYCYKTYDSNVSGRYGSIVGWKESGTVYDNNTSNVVYYYRSYSKKTDVRENLSLIG